MARARTLREWIPRDRIRVRDRGITAKLVDVEQDDGLSVVDVVTAELVAGVGEDEGVAVRDVLLASMLEIGEDEGVQVSDRGRVEIRGAIRVRDSVGAKVVPAFDDDGLEVLELVLVQLV